jgi:small-conductance mechanosensitive channel
MKKDNEHKLSKLVGLSGLAGITSSISFFIWTNFGHWITTNMYTKDLGGLIDCYINAIPFLKPQLAGNLIIVPIFVLVTYFVFNYSLRNNTKLASAKLS